MALTANLGTQAAAKFGAVQTYTGAEAIYRGATVLLKLSDGLVYKAVEDGDDSELFLCVGHAMEELTAANATLGGSDANIRVRNDGKLKRTLTGSPATKVGRLALVKDDEIVQTYETLGSGTGIVVGRISEVINSTEVYVDFHDKPSRTVSNNNQ